MMTKGLNVAVMENKSSRLPNRNGLHSTMRSTVVAKELHQRYKDLLEPLSLFTPKTKDIDLPVLHLERPVTPIDENVKLAPSSLTDLCELIQRRIAAKSEIKTVSVATQQELGGIIVSDVKFLWEVFELYSHDSTLTKTENKELGRRITAHIITVCEQLFLHYLHMMDVVRQRSVFTDEANLSRLKAQLALDCTKFLNIPAIKHQVSKEIKAQREAGETDDNISEMENLGKYKPMVSKSTSLAAPFTFKHLFNLSRPKRAPKPKQQTIESDLQEISDNMPHLDLEQHYNVLLHKVESTGDHRPMQIVAVRNLNLQAQQNEEVALTKNVQPEHQVNVKNRKYNQNVKTVISKKQNTYCCTTASHSKSFLDFCKETKDEENEPLSISDDLQNLLQISTVDQGVEADPETTLPSLIEAITYDRSNEIKKRKQQKILKELEEEEEKELKQGVQLKEPEHAQPATVNIRLSQKMMAQTADARVSDRHFIDSVYLEVYPAIYDHQQEEFDQEMVKTMDKNLSFGEELQEIYNDLLKTIPNDHLLFDEDPIIVPPAVHVDLTGSFPSDTLSGKLKERVINPELKLLDSDYGTERYLSMKKESEGKSLESENQFQKVVQQQDSNINLNDYLKYVLAQGSDYLAVLYHFYESEDEKDEERRALIVRELELKREEEMEIAEIRLVKEEFVTGSWNINTVMLGGLGKEPLPKAAKKKVEVQKLLGKNPDTEDIEHLQNRLQRIWEILHVPDRERLDMAIKYSSQKHRAHVSKIKFIWDDAVCENEKLFLLLSQAVETWENAAQLIQERECILSKLEHFERFASNPNRFFEKGYKGTSAVRLKESKRRDKFYSNLSQIENQLSRILKKIKDNFEDVVTFKGRPYLEKMQRDKVEMLYWLQQERRKCILQRISANEPVAPKNSAFRSCALADL
ncbi:coiled-coil domain-containing protein 87 [Pristis pectinata]|uniref:coiled-coil domain-containing protein 87 n=1 Tax=Pristis pectinata TaxID=685728 RepID=UPI00223D6B7F|nr:coiled-coil domain-containing protein 87 [Pristis pectinata]